MAIYARWDDVGARQLTGEAGSLIAVLDVVLIAAGWTKAFSATNRAVYRNDLTAGGNDAWLYVDDTDAQVARATCYESMTDIDTGTAPSAPAGGVFWRKSTASSNAVRPWIICADALRFYINVGQVNSTALPASGTASNSWVGGAGAPVCFYAGDPSVFTAGHSASTTYHSGIIMSASLGGAYMVNFCFHLSRNSAMSVGAIECGIPMGRYLNEDHAGYGNSSGANFPQPGPGAGYAIPLHVAERLGNGTAGPMRGRLPGAYVPICAMSAYRRMGDVLPAAPGSVSAQPVLAMAGGGGNAIAPQNGTMLVDHAAAGVWS